MSDTIHPNKIVLLGQPKSTNNIYRYACRGIFPTMYMTKEGKEIKERYQWEAKSQWKSELIKVPFVEVEIDIFFGDKRVRDIDNFSKILLDALTGIVWEDDKQIYKMTITKNYDKENPRVEVFVIW